VFDRYAPPAAQPTLKPKVPLYIYLDEAGDLCFSPAGSKLFILTSITCVGIPTWADELIQIRQKLNAAGLNTAEKLVAAKLKGQSLTGLPEK